MNIRNKACRLGSAVSTLSATSLNLQAVAFQLAQRNNDLGFAAIVHKLHQGLILVEDEAAELAALLRRKGLDGPSSFMHFDSAGVGLELIGARIVSDMQSWRAAAKVINMAGFVSSLEELQMRNAEAKHALTRCEPALATLRNTQATDDDQHEAFKVLMTFVTIIQQLQNFMASGMLIALSLTDLHERSVPSFTPA